jgi:acylphosphatase
MYIMRKLIAHVSGKVQMTGYRSKVVTIARAFDLKGYVKNLPDGRVKVLAEGSEADLERFIKAITIENTLIKVEDIQAELSEGSEAYDDFFKVIGEHETDDRLDVAAEHLKELIFVVREGFKDVREGFRDMNKDFEENGTLLKEMSAKQDDLIYAVKEVRVDIVDEVQGLRSDLKGRMEERLQRIESDVVEIKARMKS